MSNKYRETSVSGSSYVRCHTVNINNSPNNKRIRFNEVEVITYEDGRVDTKECGSLGEYFSEENANNAFPILNPADNSDTGAQMTYEGVYTVMYSLYLHLATQRDEAQATPTEE